MSKFATLSQEQSAGNPFVSKTLKPLFVKCETVFEVVGVRGPFKKSFAESAKRMREIETYYVDILLDQMNIRDLIENGASEEDVAQQMTLSFTAGYEGRDGLLEALREDIAAGDEVPLVKLIGDSSWYSLKAVV